MLFRSSALEAARKFPSELLFGCSMLPGSCREKTLFAPAQWPFFTHTSAPRFVQQSTASTGNKHRHKSVAEIDPSILKLIEHEKQFMKQKRTRSQSGSRDELPSSPKKIKEGGKSKKQPKKRKTKKSKKHLKRKNKTKKYKQI